MKHKAWTLIVGICSFKIQWKMNWRDLTSVKAKFIRRVYAETISLEVHIFCEECHTVNVITRKPICNIYRINLTLSLFTEAIIMMILTFFEMVVFFCRLKKPNQRLSTGRLRLGFWIFKSILIQNMYLQISSRLLEEHFSRNKHFLQMVWL